MVGNLYLAKIYFTDLSAYKIRPVLIIKKMGDDFVCLQISSQIKPNRILITSDDLIDGHLKKESVVVLPKNFTLHKSVLTKYLGEIENSLLTKIFERFCNALGCREF